MEAVGERRCNGSCAAGPADEVELAADVGVFGRGRAASAAALGGGAGEDDEQDAGELGGRGLLVQYEQAEQDADGGVEGHQGPERGGPHVVRREHLEGIRKDGEQQGQAGCGGQDAGGEMSGGLGGIESTIERRSKLPGQEHVPAGLLRLSVGCEHIDDLWNDLNSAVAHASRPQDPA
jgi:hypothetical protein